MNEYVYLPDWRLQLILSIPHCNRWSHPTVSIVDPEWEEIMIIKYEYK